MLWAPNRIGNKVDFATFDVIMFKTLEVAQNDCLIEITPISIEILSAQLATPFSEPVLKSCFFDLTIILSSFRTFERIVT